MLVLIRCWLLLPFWESVIVQFVVRSSFVHSSLSIISIGKRERAGCFA